ncbi:MAG: AbrB family transcriptional regulator [Gammaproteobacteria bacterium RIFCSPHIGHO2_12_FULL_42_13]|nr:MAG: AbrB family transcriptional regulator [Gammaproteobacteria bacterium RIFCSPHIGHO2_12_FULL_42_13]
MSNEITKIGKRGTVVIPAELRRQLHLKEGDLVIAENHGDGILLKPAIVIAVEKYTLEQQAEFILSNTVDAEDYRKARNEVKVMGLDPDKIPHVKPTKMRRVSND